MGKKLEELLKKREQLNAQIQKERNKLSEQQRKEDTRRKILLGALMIEMMNKGELDEKKIMKRLDEFLTKNIDRQLFELPLSDEENKLSNKTSIHQVEEQREKTKKVENHSTVEVILKEILITKKISVLKVIREVTGLGLKEAKELIEAAPSSVIKVDLKEAEIIKKRLNEAGAKVSLKK